jgi:Na+/H+-dicarboxylate symporter
MCRTTVNTFSNLVGTVVVARAEGEQVRVLRSADATSQA